MTTVRSKFLTFQEVNTLGHAAQRGVFGGIFGAVEWVITSWGRFFFFPLVTFFSILNFGYELKTYCDERNKSLGKTASLLLTGASLAAEILAVTAALTGAIMAAAFVPVVFFAMISANFLSNLVQTGYHAYKWLTAEKDSHARIQHRTACFGHFAATLTLAAAATAIGFLLMSPAQHLLTLSAGAVVAVKATTVSVLALNGVKGVRDFFVMRRKRKEREAIELINRVAVPAVSAEIKAKPYENYKGLNCYPLNESLRKEHGIDNKSLEKEISSDLVKKVEKANGLEKEVVLDFIYNAKQSLQKDWNGNGEGAFKSWFTDHQRIKREKKLKVVQWWMELVDTGRANVGTMTTPRYVYSLDELKPEIDALGSDVFSSLFATKINAGKMEKLEKVVEHYMLNILNQPIYKGEVDASVQIHRNIPY